MSNLAKRILSAIILAPLVLWIIYLGGIPFKILISVATFIMLLEWHSLVKKSSNPLGWNLLGIIYILVPCSSLIIIREVNGYIVTFLLIAAVWATDIGAYIFGKIIGGPKICPKISPNKTWAGLVGGMIFSALTVAGFIYYFSSDLLYKIEYTAIAGAVLAVIAQAGDFFESWVKRKFGKKDSGSLIPGHGGLLDRADGLMFASVAALIFILALG